MYCRRLQPIPVLVNELLYILNIKMANFFCFTRSPFLRHGPVNNMQKKKDDDKDGSGKERMKAEDLGRFSGRTVL